MALREMVRTAHPPVCFYRGNNRRVRCAHQLELEFVHRYWVQTIASLLAESKRAAISDGAPYGMKGSCIVHVKRIDAKGSEGVKSCIFLFYPCALSSNQLLNRTQNIFWLFYDSILQPSFFTL